MKAYGSKRFEHINCRWGCCGLRWNKSYPYRAVYDRTRRKTARQDAKKQLEFEIY